MSIYRTLNKLIPDIISAFKILVVTGMRQVGKTTFLQELCEENRKYITFDDMNILSIAKKEPQFLLEQYEPPIFIDEVQYAPEIFSHLKIFVDKIKQNGTIWITGSQQFYLMKNISETLAGRVALLNLLGFSIYELENKGQLQQPFLPTKEFRKSLLEKKNLIDTYKIIWQGFFPDVIDKNVIQRKIFYDSYIKTYIERDIRQIERVDDELTFFTFLRIIALRTGQELNYNDIARSVGISLNTAKSWLSILFTSGVVYILPHYHKNISKRLLKRPKLYFVDTGLCSYLTNQESPEALEKSSLSGAFFETFVVIEILKSYLHNGLQPSLYYLRDNNGVEIDLIIEQNNKTYPIEIKKTSNPKLDDIKNFKVLYDDIEYGNIICLTNTQIHLNNKTTAISVWDM